MSEITSPSKKAVVVLGMHRSGTSLLAGLMSNAGYAIGKSVMPAAEDNPKGFFENQRIVELNEQLLSLLGLSWSSWQRLPSDWAERSLVLEGQATELIAEEFDSSTSVCIKDPRMCRLLPFWRTVLQKSGFELFVLFTTRELGEVSASLQKRDGMSEAQANAVWFRYNLDVLHASDSVNGLHLSYQEVLNGPDDALRKVSSLLGESLDLKERGFADKSLRHHKVNETPTWADNLLQNCARFPIQPDPMLEEIVFPLLSDLADREREFAVTVAGEISSESRLSEKEAALFAQAEDARQHALSLARELDTGRQYISDLEKEHVEKDQLIGQQESTLQDMKRHSDEYVESLKTTLDDSRRYVESLEKSLSQKENELVNSTEEINRIVAEKDAYNQSLVTELATKETQLAEAHNLLEVRRDELTTLKERFSELQKRLELELRKFPVQRRIRKLLKRESDV